MKKGLKLGVAALGLVATLGAGTAVAATHTFTATVNFATPLTLTEVAAPNFGVLQAALADTYTLDTNGVVTPQGAGVVVSTVGAQAGNLDVAGSAAQLVDISAGNYVADLGVTPANATCTYGGAAQDAADCSFTAAAAPGAGTTLLVGLDAVVDGTQVDGDTALPTFDVNVVYN